jgi:hypothetical protein
MDGFQKNRKERIMLNVAVTTRNQTEQLPDHVKRPRDIREDSMLIDELLEDRFTPVALKLFLLDVPDGNTGPAAVISSLPD